MSDRGRFGSPAAAEAAVSGCCHRSVGVAILLAVAKPAGAQVAGAPATDTATDCPVVGGVRASVTARDTGRAVPRELVRVDRRTSVDTTFTFDVGERRWNFASLAASVAAGLADTVRGRWYLCAGAAVGLTRPTIVVRGARGEVRVRASLAQLSRALQPSRPTGRPRTPPRRS
jgi:hypothetical protein